MAKKERPGSSPAPDAAQRLAQERERERRNFIEISAGSGMPPEEIALLLVPAITVERLKADYAVELEMGPAKANLEVSTGLLAAARKGNVGAMIYWTKARMGWTEKAAPAKETLPPSEGTPAQAPMPSAESLTRIPLTLVKK